MRIVLLGIVLSAAALSQNPKYNEPKSIGLFRTLDDGSSKQMLVRSVISGICKVKFSGITIDGRKTEEQGTGFFVNDQGDFVTAKHVVPPGAYQDGEELVVHCPYSGYDIRAGGAGVDLEAKKVAFSADSDVRLLKVAGQPNDVQPLSFASADPDIASGLQIVGYFPQDGQSYPLVRALTVEQRTDYGTFRTSGAVLKGMSGSPVLNDIGEVVGIYSERRDLDLSGSALLGEAVSAAQFSKLLDSRGIRSSSPPMMLFAGKITEIAEKDFTDKHMERVRSLCRPNTICVSPVIVPEKVNNVCKVPWHSYVYPC